ncbi:MAG: TonB-dependent receptor [Oceanococcus sp.]
MNIKNILYGLCLTLCLSSTALHAEEDWDALFGDDATDTEVVPAAAPPPTNTPRPSRAGAPVAVIELPENPAPSARPASQRRQIEEIIVTAQKTEQSLQDVPVSVSAVDADSLRKAGIIGPEGIENQVPNLEMDGDPQAPSIGIRGFSTDSFNIGLEPSVGLMIDQLFIGRTEFIPDGLFDLQGVEVLRGPQGTLFGKNTIAGVLIFSTAQASQDGDGQLLLSGGERGMLRGEAGTSLSLTDNVSARLALTHWRNDGEVENSFLNRGELSTDQTAGRVKFSADVSDQLNLKLNAQLSSSKHDYPGWQLYDLDSDALEYAQSKHAATEDNPLDGHTAFDLPAYVHRDSDLVHGIAEYDMGDFWGMSDVLFTAVLGQAGVVNDVLMDFDVSAADLVGVKADFEYQQTSLELRFNGRADTRWGDGLEFVGGLFGFESQMDMLVDVAVGSDLTDFALTPAGAEALGAPSFPGGSNPLGLILNAIAIPGPDFNDGVTNYFLQDTVSYALFGQATWFLNQQWAAIIGLRLGSEEKDALIRVAPYGPGFTGAILEADDFESPLARDESEVSPKLGMRYEITDSISTYVTWTRGFKSGGFNAISFQDTGEGLQFEPEQADAWELGFKSRLLDNSLSLNGAVYYTDVSNMQVVNFNGVGFDVFNADGAELQGLELDLSWLPPIPWLSIDASLGISSAEYRSYPNGPTTAEQDNNGETEQDLSGRTLPRAPTMSGSFRPTISLPVGRWFGHDLGIQIGLDASYRGEQYLTLDLDEKSRQEAYWLYGARLILGPQHDESWALILNGSNISNTKALNFVADHNLYANSYFANQIPERMLSLSLSMQW